MYIAYYLLPIAYCLLPYYLLPIAFTVPSHCLLPIAYCLLPTAYCLLPLVPWLPIAQAWSTAGMIRMIWAYHPKKLSGQG